MDLESPPDDNNLFQIKIRGIRWENGVEETSKLIVNDNDCLKYFPLQFLTAKELFTNNSF